MLQEIGFGSGAQNLDEIENYSQIATLIYIAEYAAIASFFVALQEGRRENAILYAIGLLPCSYASFLIGKLIG